MSASAAIAIRCYDEPSVNGLGSSPYCMSMQLVLTAPRASLATRLNDFATNRYE